MPLNLPDSAVADTNVQHALEEDWMPMSYSNVTQLEVFTGLLHCTVRRHSLLQSYVYVPEWIYRIIMLVRTTAQMSMKRELNTLNALLLVLDVNEALRDTVMGMIRLESDWEGIQKVVKDYVG